jgi:RND family efflux transporter MFP subunit
MNDGLMQKLLLRVAIPGLILLIGAACAGALVFLAPSAGRGGKEVPAPLVDVVVVEHTDALARVEASGLVVPAREVSITPEVSGRIIAVSDKLRVGGRFGEGEVMARIDPRDYLLAIEVEKGRVHQAELEYELEIGRGDIARREWELLGNGRPASEAPLALRKPHLETAAQNLEGARSSLKRAELALERTSLRAPFNAIIIDERIDVGQVVGPGGPIITLHGTDRFWVQVSVPVEKLSVLDIPGLNAPDGSLARVTQGTGAPADVARTGQLVGLAGQLEPQTRMAQLLVAVDAPLDEPSGALPLLAGSFVDVTLFGRSLRDTVAIPRTAVTDGDRVWIVTPENTLARRTVEIGWRDATSMYVDSGLVPGERVVTSPLATPLEGLPVRTADDAAAALEVPR